MPGSNVSSGSRFERLMGGILSEHGFWVLIVPKNAGGQQPADLVAVKRRYHALIDCKVLSTHRFPFERIEDNQHSAMEKFREIGGEVGWFAILLPDGAIRMLDLDTVHYLEHTGKHSLNERELTGARYTCALSEWTEMVSALCE